MKLKSKLLASSLIAFIMLFTISKIQAQHRPVKHPVAKKKMVQSHHANHPKVTKVHAIKFIKRTNLVIIEAHKVVKRNKVYTGDLSKAIQHQRYAKVLATKNKSHRAIQHSRLARAYALKAIKNNKGVAKKEWQMTKEETVAAVETVTDEELEKELKTNNPNIEFDDSAIKDKDLTELEVLEMDPSEYKNQ